MGVNGLQSFMKEHCPKACYRTRISTLVKKHQEESDERAEIVVDTVLFFPTWCKGLNWIIGMEVQVLMQRIQSFLTKFQNINVDLVFFIPVSMETKKLGWLDHTRLDWQTMKNVFDTLTSPFSRTKSCQDILEATNEVVPPNMTDFVAYVLKYVFNCKVFISPSVYECRADIIRYVTKHESIAILSDNTDFIVSDVECVMLSVKDLNFSQMTTLLYDRNKLCKKLRIVNRNLPYLAVLAGTDDYDSEPLKAFLRRNVRFFTSNEFTSNECLFKNYADCMNAYTCLEELIEYIYEMGGMELEDQFIAAREMKRVFASYSYCYKSRPRPGSGSSKDWCQVLKIAEARLRKVLLPVSVWTVLNLRLYKNPPCVEKYTVADINDGDPKELSSATITRPLRQRLYGILFNEIKQSNPVVTEWCRDNGNCYHEPVIVQPEYIEADHPGLRALWYGNQPDMNHRIKWTLFLKTISSNKPIQNLRAWMNLPVDLVVSTAACFYLYMDRDFLNESELEIILATVAMYPAFNRDSLDFLFDGECDLGSLKISGTFDLTFNLVFNVLASCGYPVPMNEETAYMKFEPKLFQYLYKRVKSEPDYPVLYGHGDCIERFNQMYDAIHSWDVPT